MTITSLSVSTMSVKTTIKTPVVICSLRSMRITRFGVLAASAFGWSLLFAATNRGISSQAEAVQTQTQTQAQTQAQTQIDSNAIVLKLSNDHDDSIKSKLAEEPANTDSSSNSGNVSANVNDDAAGDTVVTLRRNSSQGRSAGVVLGPDSGSPGTQRAFEVTAGGVASDAGGKHGVNGEHNGSNNSMVRSHDDSSGDHDGTSDDHRETHTDSSGSIVTSSSRTSHSPESTSHSTESTTTSHARSDGDTAGVSALSELGESDKETEVQDQSGSAVPTTSRDVPPPALHREKRTISVQQGTNNSNSSSQSAPEIRISTSGNDEKHLRLESTQQKPSEQKLSPQKTSLLESESEAQNQHETSSHAVAGIDRKQGLGHENQTGQERKGQEKGQNGREKRQKEQLKQQKRQSIRSAVGAQEEVGDTVTHAGKVGGSSKVGGGRKVGGGNTKKVAADGSRKEARKEAVHAAVDESRASTLARKEEVLHASKEETTALAGSSLARKDIPATTPAPAPAAIGTTAGNTPASTGGTAQAPAVQVSPPAQSWHFFLYAGIATGVVMVS